MTPKENNILIQAREVYKNRESEYYLEIIRKTSDELERTLTELTELKRDVKRFMELLMKDNHTGRDTFDIEILKNKLMEVGNEE